MPRYPNRPYIGVGALVVEEGRVLMVKRKYPPRKGYWSIPGGHVELGERVEDAAVRELREETGLEAEPLGIVNLDELIVYDKEGAVEYHYVLVDVLVERKSGELQASSDALDARWMDISEVAGRTDVTMSTRGLMEKIIRGEVRLDKPFKPKLTSYTC
ncbi:MAG: NUDIX hydrolase [Desulfurococcales archaeon]|nr:NUDIX hydrolase [Desulfurococcales archaeon]